MKFHLPLVSLFSLLPLGMLGCSEAGAPKAYGRFSACVVGPKAGADRLQLAQQLRSLQLDRGADRATWPTRCNQYADGLYTATGDMPLIHRALEKQLGCKEGGGCALPTDETLGLAMSGIWDAVDGAKLSAEPATDVVAPKAVQAPLIDAKGWKRLSEEAVKTTAPRVTSDGRAQFLMVPKAGGERLFACEFPAGSPQLNCFISTPKVPGISVQSIKMTRDSRAFFGAGLTTEGLRAFDLKSGETSDVRGTEHDLVSDGLAIERGTAPTEGPVAIVNTMAGTDATPSTQEAGYVATLLSHGKAGKGVHLEVQPIGEPIVAAGSVVYLAKRDGENAALMSKRIEGAKAKDDAVIPGKFVGAFHTCEREGRTALATYAQHSKQRDGKPTAGTDQTQVAMVFHDEHGWSQVVEATVPFGREVESELTCTPSGANLTWARAAEGGAEVGRLDCDPKGCKTTRASLPGVDSKWWWSAASLGDKVLVVWRGALGETRMRLASLADLPHAAETLLFDSPEFGGPETGEAFSFVRDGDVVLLFRTELPVALRVDAAGKASIVQGRYSSTL